MSSPSHLELDAAPLAPEAAKPDPPDQDLKRSPLDVVAIVVVLVGAAAVAVLGAGWTGIWDILLIVGGTCISEDLTSLTVGNLLRDGRVAVSVGLTACFLGIVLSDTGIWAIGKYAGRPLLSTRWLAPFRRRILGRRRSGTARRWLRDRVAAAMMICRFVPGMRVPTYFLAGAWGVDLRRFLFWSMLAAGVWVPLIVLIVAQAGGAIARPLEAYLGGGIVTLVVSVAFGLALLRASAYLATSRGALGRLKLRARLNGSGAASAQPAQREAGV